MKRPLYSDFYSDAKLKGSSIFFFLISSLNAIIYPVHHLWERKYHNKVPSRLVILKASRIQRTFSASVYHSSPLPSITQPVETIHCRINHCKQFGHQMPSFELVYFNQSGSPTQFPISYKNIVFFVFS